MIEFARQKRQEHGNRLTTTKQTNPTRPKQPATTDTAAQQRKKQKQGSLLTKTDKRGTKNTKTRPPGNQPPPKRPPSFLKRARHQASASSLISNASCCADIEVPLKVRSFRSTLAIASSRAATKEWQDHPGEGPHCIGGTSTASNATPLCCNSRSAGCGRWSQPLGHT